MLTTDFAVNPQMHIVAPSIEIEHSEIRLPATQISLYMHDAITKLGAVFEKMIAFMCASHAKKDSLLPVQIALLPEDWQASQHVRYSWGLYDGERVIPAG